MQTTAFKSDLLTRQQAAAYLNLRKSTLDAWAHKGGGPTYVKLGRAVRYRIVDLEAYVESRIRRNTSEV